MNKYKITIIDHNNEKNIYNVESKFDNFFTALNNDLKYIENIICGEDCAEYDWEHII